MTKTILLIGPLAIGKSTVGKLLAEQLTLPYIELDDICWDYYKEKGFDQESANDLIESGVSLATFTAHIKPLEAYAVERFVATRSGILDFSAGHLIHEDETLSQQIATAFAPHQNVVLLIPSPDPEESIAILQKRILKRIQKLGEGYNWAIEENKNFVRHLSNSKLPKITIYTQDKTPTEICAEIMTHLDLE